MRFSLYCPVQYRMQQRIGRVVGFASGVSTPRTRVGVVPSPQPSQRFCVVLELITPVVDHQCPCNPQARKRLEIEISAAPSKQKSLTRMQLHHSSRENRRERIEEHQVMLGGERALFMCDECVSFRPCSQLRFLNHQSTRARSRFRKEAVGAVSGFSSGKTKKGYVLLRCFEAVSIGKTWGDASRMTGTSYVILRPVLYSYLLTSFFFGASHASFFRLVFLFSFCLFHL